MSQSAIEQAVIAHLRAVSARDDVPIGPETEIYEDLGIYGDDLFEIVLWVHKTWRVDISTMRLSDYAPNEGSWGLSRLFRKVLKLPSPYRACTVSMLLSAIECGRWED